MTETDHYSMMTYSMIFYSKLFDGQVWDFKGRVLKSRLEVGSSVVKIVYNRLNGNNKPCFAFESEIIYYVA